MPAKKKVTSSKKKKNPPTTAATKTEVGIIAIRGAWQNNLKGIDLDLALGKLNVITGPSGSGKSSLAFQTIYAEGQRRYVETFSPYTRQFFDRMDKPLVDEIRGIPPAIAIEQNNTIRSTRSTVGTMTEINDYLKLLWPRIAAAACPSCKQPVKPDSAAGAVQRCMVELLGKQVLVTFPVAYPADMAVAEFFAFLNQQGFLRVVVGSQIYRTDASASFSGQALPPVVPVIQDRIKVELAVTGRLTEAVETALHLGKGKVALMEAASGRVISFSKGWHCAACDLPLREPTAALFSFNSAIGACTQCRGFGRTIGIELDRALPDKALSIRGGLIKAFAGSTYSECKEDLIKAARRRGLSVDLPFEQMAPEDKEWILYGEDGGDPEAQWESGQWYGVQGFFDYLEKRSYKMHVRVFLSRFRTYTLCRVCRGARLQKEALAYKVGGLTLPQWWQLPVNDLLATMALVPVPEGDQTARLIFEEVGNRLKYLQYVGLGYLNLDRAGRTLSGGEVMRVNLTTCLGASLVNTLFVLDEPSIGLHPRDTGRLIDVMENLRDKGNTLLVVEHEESVMRAADRIIEIGPGRGEQGGELVFHGAPDELERAKGSLTADYLLGKKKIPVPTTRRQRKPKQELVIERAAENNLRNVTAKIPLGLFTCVTGVSGSGKSTLIHQVLYENLCRLKGEATSEEPGKCAGIRGAELIGEVVMVDQSPPGRTPRSTPAVYVGAWDHIRALFTDTPAAQEQALPVGFFSFNSGNGRCGRCMGAGFEKVEMQFLSDLFVKCQECEGKRFRPEALEICWQDKNIHEVLDMTVTEAVAFFRTADEPLAKKAADTLAVLVSVGLGYLRLGQPLNTLSGGESQRLKLVGHMSGIGKARALLILDEPTTGLHFDDIALLLQVFQKLVDRGHSLVVIEHNMEVIKCADWVLDLGPEAGEDGGTLVVAGTPEDVAACPQSHTGRELLWKLDEGAGRSRAAETPTRARGSLPAVAPAGAGIIISGAREHNLKNLTVEIPRDKFVVVTGLSGSGKSTLAFDIVFAEGQRRFLDSMSTYARQFVEQMERPEVDMIAGLPPTVAIEQRLTRGGGKSTVATVTEVYHFLRLLYAKTGVQHCPVCRVAVEQQSPGSIAEAVRTALKKGPLKICAPLIKAKKGFHDKVAQAARAQGFMELVVDGKVQATGAFKKLERFKEHTIDAVVAQLHAAPGAAELDAIIARALKAGKGVIRLLGKKGEAVLLNSRRCCPDCGEGFEELDPRLFSFNSPHGWCPECRGYGTVRGGSLDTQRAASLMEAELQEDLLREKDTDEKTLPCYECHGGRLTGKALAVTVGGFSIGALTQLPVKLLTQRLESIVFTGTAALIARDILSEIRQRLQFLDEVGLGYLQLNRSATTLSGGESQRIRLAAQLGSNLRGVLYVLDEPTIGLHPRDNEKLLNMLVALRDKGNSLLVVEHDEETMRRSDCIIDMGPGAGMFGGEIVARGTVAQLSKDKRSVTGRTLGQTPQHPSRGSRRAVATRGGEWLTVQGARANNLRDVEVKIPVGKLTVMTGVSGSGKSSFMRGVLHPLVTAALKKRGTTAMDKADLKKHGLEALALGAAGLEYVSAVYEVDQSPIGKTSRSTPGTYVKVFDEIRSLFAALPAAKMRGYTASRFSFNTEGGRCETCGGNGVVKQEMSFLPTSHVLCDDCRGKRYNTATLEVEYHGQSIAAVMDMTISQAAEFFAAHSKIAGPLALLTETGTGYLKLGQPSPTLSGGEAQRLKLVAELSRGVQRSRTERLRKNRSGTGNLYLIEEPTIGLHPSDVARLVDVLHRLVDDGHTVVVIEHNVSLMAEADWIIDMGPEAGAAGGLVVAAGTPEAVAKHKVSRTARFLAPLVQP